MQAQDGVHSRRSCTGTAAEQPNSMSRKRLSARRGGGRSQGPHSSLGCPTERCDPTNHCPAEENINQRDPGAGFAIPAPGQHRGQQIDRQPDHGQDQMRRRYEISVVAGQSHGNDEDCRCHQSANKKQPKQVFHLTPPTLRLKSSAICASLQSGRTWFGLGFEGTRTPRGYRKNHSPPCFVKGPPGNPAGGWAAGRKCGRRTTRVWSLAPVDCSRRGSASRLGAGGQTGFYPQA